MPLFPEYSELDEAGAAGTRHTIVDVLVVELKDVKLFTAHD
jgi:hypothetical protein